MGEGQTDSILTATACWFVARAAAAAACWLLVLRLLRLLRTVTRGEKIGEMSPSSGFLAVSGEMRIWNAWFWCDRDTSSMRARICAEKGGAGEEWCYYDFTNREDNNKRAVPRVGKWEWRNGLWCSAMRRVTERLARSLIRGPSD